MIAKASQEYQLLQNMTTKEACEYIELSHQNFAATIQAVQKRPEIVARMQ